MNNENADVTTEKPKRIHDEAPSDLFANFMKSGWTPSSLGDLPPLEVVTSAFSPLALSQPIATKPPPVRPVGTGIASYQPTII